MDLSALGNDIERVVVSQEQIQNRLKELAVQVDKDYVGRDLILVGVLKGAVMAMADFSRYLQRHVDMDWMAVSSYGAGKAVSEYYSDELKEKAEETKNHAFGEPIWIWEK